VRFVEEIAFTDGIGALLGGKHSRRYRCG
jgi:hypothetical protein